MKGVETKLKTSKPRRKRKETNKTSLYDKLNEALLEAIEKGTDPWRKEWKDLPVEKMLPHNPVTKHIYTGNNALLLMIQDREDARWLTFNQAKEKGWNVKAGEHGTNVYYFARHLPKNKDPELEENITERPSQGQKEQTNTDIQNKQDEQGEQNKKTLGYLVARSYTVFNAGQINGIPPRTDLEPYLIPQDSMWHPCSLAERFITATGADIKIGPKNKNFYRYGTSSDSIYVSDPRQFERPEGYYSTILHELGHWTGHPDRMGRLDPLNIAVKGDERYVKEELVADIASLYFMTELGIPPTLDNTAAYVASWAKHIKEDENGKQTSLIAEAMKDASKAVSYAFRLAFERDPELKNDLAKAHRVWLFGEEREQTIDQVDKDKENPMKPEQDQIEPATENELSEISL